MKRRNDIFLLLYVYYIFIMKSLKDYIIEGAGHYKNRLGAGSSGTTYKIENGKIRKTFRLASSHNEIAKEHEIIDKWAKIKSGLKVIPYIYDVDYDGYTMDMFEVPCKEGDLIQKVLFKCLFSPERRRWDDKKIQKAIDLVGKDDAEWVMNWLDDFCDDYKKIMGQGKIADDIKSANIGKDKKGNIVCFDWFDPYWR